MFIKATYNNEECLLNTDYIVDIFNADKWVADVYVLDIDRDCYKVKQSEIQRLIENTADTPQTDAEIPKNALRSDCTGCRFVGTYDTEFPCVNCVRKNKDYYTSEQTEERSE